MVSKSQTYMAMTLFMLAVVAGAFQNCSANRFGSSQNGHLKSSGGNYDGKVFALIDPLNLCADGSPVISRILLEDHKYLLERKDCQDVQRQEIPSSEISVSGDSIVFQSQTLRALPEETVPPVAPNLICKGIGTFADGTGGTLTFEVADEFNGIYTGYVKIISNPGQAVLSTSTARGELSRAIPSTQSPEVYRGVDKNGYAFELQISSITVTANRGSVYRNGNTYFTSTSMECWKR